MSTQNASTFDPYTQNITVLSSDGTNIVQNNVSLYTIDSDHFYAVSVSLNYGSQIGASISMLVLLLLLTRREKRKSPIFFLNATSLLLVFISRILLAMFFFGDYNSFYTMYTGDFSYCSTGQRATQITATIIGLFITITINWSLVLQAKTVVHNVGIPSKYFRLIIGISVLVLLNAVIFRGVLTGEIIKAILGKENFLDKISLIKGSLASEMLGVWWFCLVFSGKLLIILRTRRAKKWTRQASMEVLVIGTFYTQFPESGSLALAMVALFLPLTSLWATATPNADDTKILPAKDMWGSKSSTGSSTCSCGGCHCSTTSKGGVSSQRRGSGATPLNNQARRPSAKTEEEFDLEKLSERDIRVMNSYTVMSDDRSIARSKRDGPSDLFGEKE